MRLKYSILLILLLCMGACVMHKTVPHSEIEYERLAVRLSRALVANPWIEGFGTNSGRKPILMIGSLGIEEAATAQNLNKRIAHNLLQSGAVIIAVPRADHPQGELDVISIARHSNADFLLIMRQEEEGRETDLFTQLQLIDLASGESQPLSDFSLSSL